MSGKYMRNKTLIYISLLYIAPTRLKARLKIAWENALEKQLEKVRFTKVNDLKLTQVELISFYHLSCVAANASELFCMAHLANIDL